MRHSSRWLLLLVVLTAWLGSGSEWASAEVSISLGPDGRSFEAVGASGGDQFVVRVAGGNGGELPPMAGEMAPIEGGLRFTAQFPLVPGVTYRASVGDVAREFAIAAEDPTPVARIIDVYPSADELPENLLKFYLHFSAPMAIGEAAQHVHLIGSDGMEVELPFLELAEELWDPDGQRLTLFFDPGRVKRGLRPHEEHGRALVAGEEYELRVDSAWRDAHGRPMREGFSKRFRARAADYDRPDATTWALEAPTAGTREAVRLRFSEALDHGLLGRVLLVYGDGGVELAGAVEIAKGETEWCWTPNREWAAGSYRIVVEALLEDMAGNSVARLFEEVGGVKEAWNVSGGRFIRLPFVVAEP